MGIGASIFMICLGAIVTFGIRRHIVIMDWIDLELVGWVLMIGGVLGLVTTLIMWGNRRQQHTVVERHHQGPPPPY
ncbi:MAG: hypothetical protein GEU94_16165 [Micromonosporaceae bacterium]|nr:hypothetical protein [Micromonosporaceae bacterium]